MARDAEACCAAANVKHYERPVSFGMLPVLMSVDNGLLTPKVMKHCDVQGGVN
jgi:hypothetical protein